MFFRPNKDTLLGPPYGLVASAGGEDQGTSDGF